MFHSISPRCRLSAAVRLLLARQFGAALALLHVLPTSIHYRYPYAALGYGNAIETADWLLKQIAEGTVSQDLSRQIITERLHRYDVSLAREMTIDLIILTTGGHTGLKHILLDSITEGVVRDAPCHVLVIRQERSTSLPEEPGFRGGYCGSNLSAPCVDG